MRWLLACLSLLACQAQQDLYTGVSLLERIKSRMAENLGNLPNYTCTESIERSRVRGPGHKPEWTDAVRLEVAIADQQELYGWPGAHRISESDLGKLVSGAIGNGDFGLFARAIFLAGSTEFIYAGEAQLNGTPALRFKFRVPLAGSSYHLQVPPKEAVVGYHGSFWVNKATLDLLRLELEADDIPAALGVSQATHTLDYQVTFIGGSRFLLPAGRQYGSDRPVGLGEPQPHSPGKLPSLYG